MKKQILLVLALIQLQNAFGQRINYQKTLRQTLATAAKTHKPVFIHMVTDTLPVPGFPEIINSKSVVSFYNTHFINYAVIATDTAAAGIRARFHPDKLPAYIFLDSRGQIIYKASGDYPFAAKYLEIAKAALQRLKSDNTISHFEQLDKRGKLITTAQFKAYINLRRELGLDDDQALLDRMVAGLKLQDLDDYNTVWFIIQAGPIVNSRIYNLIYSNRKLIDSIFKKEPLAARIAANTRTITNSRNLAIKNKDIRLAEASSNYARSTWGNDYKKAYKTATNEMLIYYKAVKDTTNFYNMAGFYYDQNYLFISADSAKKLQTNAVENLEQPLKSTLPLKGKDTVIVRQIVVKGAPYSAVASVLNNAAWDFYTFGTHNTAHLIKALLWSKRSIELQPVYNYYDTMAHIMYRLNFKDEALLNQQRAIDMAGMLTNAPKTEITYLKGEFEKMKNQTL